MTMLQSAPAPRQGLTDAQVRELPAVLTVTEVAVWLRSSPDTVYGLAASGALPSLRLGRSLRFSKAAVLAFIDGSPGDAA
ncbi:MAG TPA: helix-turn-helix domain-containing protein [Acidothermaceae bacterium]